MKDEGRIKKEEGRKPQILRASNSRGRLGGADFAGDSARFVFERADGKTGGGLTVAKILSNPLLETAASFALRDVYKIVQEQFAVAPRFRANYDRVAESDATRVSGNDTSAPSRVSQFAAFRQRYPIDDQHSNALPILNTGPARILHVLRTQGRAVDENEFFLCFGPLISERQKLFECLLIDHVVRG
ncbi:MAG: hypothetical protein QOC70_2283 [Verrucomicrobiota bacterium]